VFELGHSPKEVCGRIRIRVRIRVRVRIKIGVRVRVRAALTLTLTLTLTPDPNPIGPRAVVEERLERLAVVRVRRVRLVLGARRASAVAPLTPPQLLVRFDAPLEVRVRGAVGVRRLVGCQWSGSVVRVRVRVRG